MVCWNYWGEGSIGMSEADHLLQLCLILDQQALDLNHMDLVISLFDLWNQQIFQNHALTMDFLWNCGLLFGVRGFGLRCRYPFLWLDSVASQSIRWYQHFYVCFCNQSHTYSQWNQNQSSLYIPLIFSFWVLVSWMDLESLLILKHIISWHQGHLEPV